LSALGDLVNYIRRKRIDNLTSKLQWQLEKNKIESELQNESHSLRWVWEFSKKAVLICFLFYMIVQVYSMVVMVTYCDFTNLGELINQTGEIVQNCVFAYLIKAGIENTGKIICSHFEHQTCSDEENIDEPEG
jgi:hypothetical protein